MTLGIFSGATQRWLDFAGGAVFAVAGLAAGALVGRSERVAAQQDAPVAPMRVAA